jgi:transcriptional regulator with XRE-family HTH domain
MTASIGPTVRRRRLGTELRRLREARSVKLEEVADKLGLAASTLSRIETGKAPTRTAYLTAMLDMYGVHDPAGRQILLDMAREGHRKGWWAAWEDVLPTGFDVYVGLEAEAASVRAYETLVVHGLLQTEAYARLVSTAVRRKQTPEQIERLVALRMQRQEVILRADPLELWLILDEAVIRRTMGSPELMREQLDHLAEASQWPHITLQVLPFCAGPHPCLNGPFAIIEFPDRFDPDVVYTEGVAGQAYLEREKDVRARAEAFDLLRAAALSPADSTELIMKMAREIVLPTKGNPDDTGSEWRPLDQEPRLQLGRLRGSGSAVGRGRRAS